MSFRFPHAPRRGAFRAVRAPSFAKATERQALCPPCPAEAVGEGGSRLQAAQRYIRRRQRMILLAQFYMLQY